MGKTGYRLLAYISLSLGVAGIVLPLLPTTPFVLLAAWSASRGSPAFESWLHNHARFGPLIRDWHERQAVPLSAKWLATILLASSWAFLWWWQSPPVVLVITGLFFSGLVIFLFTRPTA
ncbi:YbaN family protein [Marinobacter sp.]|uniref:YbaN family protein n=1 Tax=Marinobacter sp. TaxID=50741 RepID=UPI0035698B41